MERVIQIKKLLKFGLSPLYYREVFRGFVAGIYVE
jgi:hypothetical protein